MDIHTRHKADVDGEGEAAEDGKGIGGECGWTTGGGEGCCKCDQVVEKWPWKCCQTYRKFLNGWSIWNGKDAIEQNRKPDLVRTYLPVAEVLCVARNTVIRLSRCYDTY